MSGFQHKPGSGSLFKNDRKEKENQPDYKGRGILESGEEFEIAAWLRDSANGQKFMSLKIGKPQPKQDTAAPDNTKAVTNDDIPF
jgi:uncharacterized protein (DUF736 family)